MNNPQYQQNPGYGNPYASQQAPNYRRPAVQLKSDRSWIVFILLNYVTCTIYGIVGRTGLANDLNTIVGGRDGKSTMHYCLNYFLLTPVTFGIFGIIWEHGFAARIGAELNRRRINYDFGAKDFWLWGVLGMFIFVGPFIYTYKLFTAMNLLAEDYNIKG